MESMLECFEESFIVSMPSVKSTFDLQQLVYQ